MMKPLGELINEINERGKFEKCRQDEEAIHTGIDMLFKIFNARKSQISARIVYSGVADLARLGKYDLAMRHLNKFEREVGYDIL